MNARRAPEWILFRHPPNQVAQFTVDLRPSTTVTRFPAPPGSESRPVPANNRLRLNDPDGPKNPRKEPIKPYKQGLIGA